MKTFYNHKFNDFLKIMDYDFSSYKFIVFYWKSWSWKSSYIKNLIKYNKSVDRNSIVIDEIFDFIDFFKQFKYFKKDKKILIATHIHPIFFIAFKIIYKVKFLITDRNLEKIKDYLYFKKYSYTEEVIKQYVSKFWATYTDIDIILENYKWNNFDQAYYYFIKNNTLSLNPNKK